VGRARVRKVSAQLVEDEDYQLRYERVAGIDVAKAKADVCTRLPPAREGGRRTSRVETVGATAREVLALAGRLIADGVEVVVMESTSVIRGRQQASATASDRPALSVSPSVADGLSAGPSATQIADCGAHLAPTSRRCRFCLPAADASATTRPAQCPIFGF
jgi:hypothetical protein